MTRSVKYSRCICRPRPHDELRAASWQQVEVGDAIRWILLGTKDDVHCEAGQSGLTLVREIQHRASVHVTDETRTDGRTFSAKRPQHHTNRRYREQSHAAQDSRSSAHGASGRGLTGRAEGRSRWPRRQRDGRNEAGADDVDSDLAQENHKALS